jgi:lactate dehydrogenase-like 2-hydroxyacid dehydrogenase
LWGKIGILSLGALGPNRTVINIARGSIVDTNALIIALKTDIAKDAGLYVISVQLSSGALVAEWTTS